MVAASVCAQQVPKPVIVEKIVEKPVIKYIEKIVYVDKPGPPVPGPPVPVPTPVSICCQNWPRQGASKIVPLRYKHHMHGT